MGIEIHTLAEVSTGTTITLKTQGAFRSEPLWDMTEDMAEREAAEQRLEAAI